MKFQANIKSVERTSRFRRIEAKRFVNIMLCYVILYFGLAVHPLSSRTATIQIVMN